MRDFSKIGQRKFDSGDPLYRGKLWVRITTHDSEYWHLFWRRIAIVLAALAVCGWLATAGGLWMFVKYQRGYAAVSYLDLIFYPLRAQHYRTGLGRHYLARGHAELEAKNYLNGYRWLRAGLDRVPDDVEARRQVAELQVQFGQAELALKTLTAGPSLAKADLGYLRVLFALLFETHNDDRALAIAGTILPAKPDAILTHQFIALQSATAHFNKGDYDHAENLLHEWRLTDSLEGEILLAKCDWERGYPELALARLENELPRFHQRDELYLQLERLHRALGNTAEARRVSLLRQFNDPASPGPRIDLLSGYNATGDRVAEIRELAAYVADFKSDPKALLLLAEFSVNTAQPTLASQVRDLAATQKFALTPFNLARIQAALADKDYRAADMLAGTALREDRKDNPTYTATLQVQRAVALFGLNETTDAKLTLAAFLNQSHLRGADARLLAKQLRLLGAVGAARDVLERAWLLEPLNQSALTELIRLDIEFVNRPMLAQNLPKLLQAMKPSRELLQEALLRLDQPDDASLRAQIRSALVRVTAQPAPN